MNGYALVGRLKDKGIIKEGRNGNTILVADKLTFLATHQKVEELKDNE